MVQSIQKIHSASTMRRQRHMLNTEIRQKTRDEFHPGRHALYEWYIGRAAHSRTVNNMLVLAWLIHV
jgi:hypothetical protein